MQIANQKFNLVVVGVSSGGLHALQTLLAGLPGDFPWPLAVVQHRTLDADDTLARLLQTRTVLPVTDVLDKEPIQPGHVYLAPPDYHLLVEAGWFALSKDAPVSYSRPSIDVLFESAADVYGAGVIGVVLTGASADGARGAARIKACGGCVVVQDPDTAECSVMPCAALAATAVDGVLKLEAIAGWLSEKARSSE